jgi:hypothetical protein
MLQEVAKFQLLVIALVIIKPAMIRANLDPNAIVDIYQRIAALFKGQNITSRDLIKKRICKTAVEGEKVLVRMAEIGLGTIGKTTKNKPMLSIVS